MSVFDPRIQEVVKKVVSHLVAHRYEELEAETRSQRLTAEEIRAAIDEYGAVLAMPPGDAFSQLDTVQVFATSRPEWAVNCPLRDADGNRTDLTLELTIYDDGGSALNAEINGIHVL